MKKTIEITPTKAVRIEPVLIQNKPYISLRQMYKTKSNPEWQHGRQGLNIDLESAASVAKFIQKFAAVDVSEFTVLELKDKGSESSDSDSGSKTTKKTGAGMAKTGRGGKKKAPWDD